MKKLILIVIVAALVVGGYSWLKKQHVNLDMLEGTLVKVHRGDLDVPISASGRIEPSSIAQIKGKASGEVIKIPQKLGDMVRKGEVIVELDKSDEQRNYDSAQAQYQTEAIALQRAEVALDEAKNVDVPLAKASVAQAEAQLSLTKVRYDFQLRLQEASPTSASPEERDTAKAQYDQSVAEVDMAKAKLQKAMTAIKYAEEGVQTAKQSLEVSQKQLAETKQRLDETTVLAPMDGMILKQHVRVGEVVQSGKTSLTGGTILIELADVSDIYAVVNVDEADIGMVRELAPEDARPGPPESQPAEDANGEQNGDHAVTRPVDLPEGTIDTGQQVEIKVESFPNERFYGLIERIAPQSEISQAIATFKVWVRITSPNKSMLVGLLNLQAEANFTAKSVRNALLVSYDAFQRDGEQFGVYVPVKDPKPGQPKYKFKACEFGRDNGIDVEVRSGLTEGEEVYTKLPVQTRKEEKEAEKADE